MPFFQAAQQGPCAAAGASVALAVGVVFAAARATGDGTGAVIGREVEGLYAGQEDTLCWLQLLPDPVLKQYPPPWVPGHHEHPSAVTQAAQVPFFQAAQQGPWAVAGASVALAVGAESAAARAIGDGTGAAIGAVALKDVGVAELDWSVSVVAFKKRGWSFLPRLPVAYLLISCGGVDREADTRSTASAKKRYGYEYTIFRRSARG